MKMETKEISELMRSNRMVMLAHISTVSVMVLFMIWKLVSGKLSPVYLVIAAIVGIAPLIGEVICWKSNPEHGMIKHLVSYGFALFYTICLFTSPTNLIYVFVIPMVFVVTIYSDIRYLLLINIGTILESIIVVVLGATKGGFGYHGIEAAIIQIVIMIMVCVNSVFTLKVIRENTRRRFTELAHAKAQAENLLESNVELGKEHENLIVLDADLAGATKTCIFQKEFPERHWDCGIAECNMTGIAAGLSTCGKVPFISSFAMFAAGRNYEQVNGEYLFL